MTVERHAGFEAQGVTRAKPRRTCAELFQTLPEPFGVRAFHIDFIAQRFTRVTGLCDPRFMAFQGKHVQRVFQRFRHLFSACELRQHILALGTLNGDRRPFRGDIRHPAVVVFDLFFQMRNVLFRIGSIDHQQQFVFLKPVEVGVIDRGTCLIRNDAVLCHPVVDRFHVACHNMLKKSDAVLSLDHQPSHVGNIKQCAVLSGVQMLRHDA